MREMRAMWTGLDGRFVLPRSQRLVTAASTPEHSVEIKEKVDPPLAQLPAVLDVEN